MLRAIITDDGETDWEEFETVVNRDWEDGTAWEMLEGEWSWLAGGKFGEAYHLTMDWPRLEGVISAGFPDTMGYD